METGVNRVEEWKSETTDRGTDSGRDPYAVYPRTVGPVVEAPGKGPDRVGGTDRPAH